jgi:hypothetical protein
MIRRRAAAAGINASIGNHSFRATGIAAYLANGGALEHAQKMAAHVSSVKTHRNPDFTPIAGPRTPPAIQWASRLGTTNGRDHHPGPVPLPATTVLCHFPNHSRSQRHHRRPSVSFIKSSRILSPKSHPASHGRPAGTSAAGKLGACSALTTPHTLCPKLTRLMATWTPRPPGTLKVRFPRIVRLENRDFRHLACS